MSEKQRSPHHFREPLEMLTFEGTARSGKGTTVRAAHEAFASRGDRVLVIDQGQKFRSLAHLAVKKGIELENPNDVDDFLRNDQTSDDMRDVLQYVDTLTPEDRDAMLYTDLMSKRAGRIGRSNHSHGLAVDLMHSQIEDAFHDRTDIVLIDGRTIEQHARSTSEHIGSVVFSAHFACDALIAARRVERLFIALEEMSLEDRMRLLQTADNIANRNASDMARTVDPLRRPSRALNFTYEKYDEGDACKVVKKCLEVDSRHLRLMVDTTRTESIDHMTAPLVEIAMAAVDQRRTVA